MIEAVLDIKQGIIVWVSGCLRRSLVKRICALISGCVFRWKAAKWSSRPSRMRRLPWSNGWRVLTRRGMVVK